MKKIYVKMVITIAVAYVLTFVFVAGYQKLTEFSFENLVTKKVIEKAITWYADDLRSQYSYNAQYGITWTAGVAGRHEVFKHFFGENWRDVLYASLAAAPEFGKSYHDSFWVAQGGNEKTYHHYQTIMKVAHETLKDPEKLKQLYLEYKPLILEQLREQKIRLEVKISLTDLLTYFKGQEIGYDSVYNFRQTAHKKMGMTDSNFLYHDWVQRRKTEGGQVLVDTWAWCINDLIQSL